MKNLTIHAFAVGFTLCSIGLSVRADNLMQVYSQALQSDPVFKTAEADWMAARQDYPLARAGNGSPGSGLFPYIDLSGDVARNYQKQQSGNLSSQGYYNGNAYLLQLTQPIFNYATWKNISAAKFQVKAATATYLNAAQDLMFRVAQAYFNVLRAHDQLQYTTLQKQSFLAQWVTARRKLHYGLSTITSVYDAEASYDQAVSQEITDRNLLQDRLEDLRAITGNNYQVLMGLQSKIPLVMPTPQNMARWVAIADTQSYAIQATLYTMLSARENIKQTRALGYPTLTGTVSYGAQTTGVIPSIGKAVIQPNGSLASFTTTTATGELDLDFPVYRGGYVGASTKRAEYQYLSASDQLESTHRDVVKQTREAYLGVQSGIQQIDADHHSIISAISKLKATEAGYSVGTRTMVDVLQAVTQRYQSQLQWSNDRYNYIISILSLKKQAGTLSPQDLSQINSWLGISVNLSRK